MFFRIIFFLGFLPSFIFLMSDMDLFLKSKFIFSFLFIGFIGIEKKLIFEKSPNHIISKFLLYLIISGTLFGIIYTALGRNELSKMINYSAISLLTYLSFDFGKKIINRVQVENLILALAISELLYFLPRVIIMGSTIRSSIGSSHYVTFILGMFLYYLSAYNTSNRKKIILYFLLLLLSLSAAAISGMRSSLIFTGISILFVLAYYLKKKSSFLFNKKSFFFIFMTIFIGYSIFSLSPSLKKSL